MRLIGEMESWRGSDNGCFDLLPHEALLYLFFHLDFHSLVRCSQVCRLFREVASDPLLYGRLELRYLFHLVCDRTLKFLLPRCALLRYLDFSLCGNYGRCRSVVLRTFVYARGTRFTHLLMANCHVVDRTVILAISRTSRLLVDLDLAGCHTINRGDFGVLAALNGLKHLNFYRTQIGHNELKLILIANKVSHILFNLNTKTEHNW